MLHFRLPFLCLACALACSSSGSDAANESAGTGLEGLPGLDAPQDVAAPPADAVLTASGLASKVLVAGDGAASPSATDTVRVHYSGWRTNGERFDSSVARGMPAQFRLDGVIAGWTEGLQLMVEGEERRLWIPEELAYRGQREPYGTLVFDVLLIEIL
ncbi:MAG TPA: FKBP-type peptidyl-prolyl cis-trans isomerase [Polyangiaceae bacterium]|nr:FKBP-type peptidyl-prolyl cis-trans isomerase [Polyangiaceae bacterium]